MIPALCGHFGPLQAVNQAYQILKTPELRVRAEQHGLRSLGPKFALLQQYLNAHSAGERIGAYPAEGLSWCSGASGELAGRVRLAGLPTLMSTCMLHGQGGAQCGCVILLRRGHATWVWLRP